MQHAQDRYLAQRPRGVEVEEQRPFERCEAKLVDPERAVEWMLAELLDQVGAPDRHAGLRPPEQLAAAEADQVGAGGKCVARGRLVAISVKAPEPRSSSSGTPWRRATSASSAAVGRSVKPTSRKFDWCTRKTSAVPAPTARS